ncbi:hypothetical protein [Chryseobacterium oryzae]|uniref:SmpA / OmlA family protein n=1 Tax=Chryseobacterium oryzae TaxID=2929799 RepID=A0ABY4BE27_9FLAO|nr:hypothetical protein [Chryseobacterium oryzae]UOE37004.1 hypothetical protein MTP08_07960 [Chryseobacterium oryzae]
MNKRIFAFLMIIGFLNSCGKISHKKFDSEIWKNSNLNTEENWDLRWQMMNDLRNKNNLIGMTKIEIENLLGKPDENSKTVYFYYLGYTEKGINTGRLSITFNTNNIVTKINVTQG